MSNSRHGTIGACCMLGACWLWILARDLWLMSVWVWLGDRFLKIVHFCTIL